MQLIMSFFVQLTIFCLFARASLPSPFLELLRFGEFYKTGMPPPRVFFLVLHKIAQFGPRANSSTHFPFFSFLPVSY